MSSAVSKVFKDNKYVDSTAIYDSVLEEERENFYFKRLSIGD